MLSCQADFAYTYRELMDESVTCFEPEAKGCLIEGLEFHKFYFNNCTRMVLGARPVSCVVSETHC
jgi:hypothetical protein